jgi:hypothetical protein
LFQQSWKARRDAYSARIDEFCKLIFEAADQGAEYWVTKKPTKLTKPPPEQVAKTRLMETKIDGHQQKINLFYVMIKPKVSTAKQDDLVNKIADFLDALTGGNFGAEVRLSDPSRARLVYSTAAELVAALRATSPQITIGAILLAVFAVVAFLILAFHPLSKPPPLGWIAV